jgi:cytochrome P450
MNIFPFTEQLLNPFQFYAKMRSNNPIVYDDRNHLWGVFRYNDVHFILENYKSFSSRLPISDEFISKENKENVTTRSPNSAKFDPLYRNQRALGGIITKAFSRMTISKLEPEVESITHDLVNGVIRKGYTDLINDFACPLSVKAMSIFLDVQEQGHNIFYELADILLRSGWMQIRNAEAKDLSQIRTQLSYELLAGHIATVNLIGNTILSLLQNPEEFKKLKEDISSTSSLIPSTIEETLRYRSPVQGVLRTTTKHVTIGKSTIIPPGETVVVWLGSANHDETVFPDPEKFDISREPQGHLGFGLGIRFCPAAPLARLICSVVLRIICDRLKYLELDSSRINLMKPLSTPILHGVSKLPLRFRTGDVVELTKVESNSHC